jgi:ABC-2 type transport system permease protein
MWRLYWRLVGARIRSQMQYKGSFGLELLGFMALTALEWGVIAIILARFEAVGGWGIAEIALLYGLTSIAFSLAEMLGRGFDAPFEIMMQRGAFDTILTRPLPSFFQILASEFQLRRLGRTLQGSLVLGYGLANAPIVWTLPSLLLLPLTIGAGVLIYLALYIISATVCFWTTRQIELIHVFASGGNELASYPLSIYNGWLRAIFLSIVPVAFANYPTALILLNRRDPLGLPPWLGWIAPLVALVFFGAALQFWRIGVSKYQSVGN